MKMMFDVSGGSCPPRVGLVAFLVVAAFAFPGAAPAAGPDAAGESVRQGEKALSEGRFGRAIELLERASLQGQAEVERNYWLGVSYWSREQREPAIQAFARAVALDPEERTPWSLYALENLAEVYTRTGKTEESTQAYRDAMVRETRPEWILTIRNQLAELDLTLGKYVPDEHTVFNEGSEIIGGVGPSRMRTNRNFEIARHTNDPRKEERYYRLAVETDPGLYQAYFNLGLALVRQGKYREAIPWLERSDVVWKRDATNVLASDKGDAHAFLALCHLELGQLEDAGDHAERAQAAGTADFWTLLYSLRVRVATGRAREALPQLLQLAAENPEHAETLHALSEALAASGRAEESRQALAVAITSIPPGHPWMTRLQQKWSEDLCCLPPANKNSRPRRAGKMLMGEQG